MPKIEGLKRVQAALNKAAAKHPVRVLVIVGFTANYALFVHEDMEMKLAGQPRPGGRGMYWDPQGSGPKFLENPAKELAGELGKIAGNAIAKGATLEQGMLLSGLRLQREAQSRVPVDAGNLKSSAFTKVE